MTRRVMVERRQRLRADPEKVRAFLQRGRGKLERKTSLKARGRKALAAKREIAQREGPLDPASWRRAVFAASDGRCVVTRTRASDADDRRFHAHHLVSQDALRRRGLYGWLWDARNGVFVLDVIHMGHEHKGGDARIPRSRLPASVWEFCAELDALDGSRWATEHVKRRHPAAGSSRS